MKISKKSSQLGGASSKRGAKVHLWAKNSPKFGSMRQFSSIWTPLTSIILIIQPFWTHSKSSNLTLWCEKSPPKWKKARPLCAKNPAAHRLDCSKTWKARILPKFWAKICQNWKKKIFRLRILKAKIFLRILMKLARKSSFRMVKFWRESTPKTSKFQPNFIFLARRIFYIISIKSAWIWAKNLIFTISVRWNFY